MPYRLTLAVLVMLAFWVENPRRALAQPNSEAIADLERVRERMVASLLEGTDLESARRLEETLESDGTWPDIDYTDMHRASWKLLVHLDRVKQLSQAARRHAAESDRAAARRAAVSALGHWLDKDYRNPNWWHNQIGAPDRVAAIMLLLGNDLPSDRREACLKILRRAKLGWKTGQNLIWVARITAARAVLQKDLALAEKMFARLADEIAVTDCEGLQADFSFHQHGPCLYNHGYGAGFAVDSSRIATQVQGTRFAFSPDKIRLISSLILDGSQWMARGPTSDMGAEGRAITRQNQTATYLTQAATNMLALPTGREDEFRALVARISGQSGTPLVGNRHFWRSDFMVHHRKAYYTSVRMFSKRTVNTDSPCNSEGLLSHHLADGCNYLLRTGREYEGIFPVWDWQKIPGTTVVQRAKLSGSVRRRGGREFVGGVSDGTYGLAAFDLVRDELTARKAWFFFDKEYVCLGAGITCSAQQPVLTTINQCLLAGDVVAQNGQHSGVLPRGVHDSNQFQWVHHDRVGYIFPQKARMQLANQKRTGDWRHINHRYPDTPVQEDVFMLVINHGTAPRDAEYAYLVVPDVSRSDLAKYAERVPVRIVRNTPDCQAAWHRELKQGRVAFYIAGEVTLDEGIRLAANQPCLVLVRLQNGRWNVSVSDPRNRESTVTVELSIGNQQHQMKFALPGGQMAGKSVTQSAGASLRRGE
ncbi:MAG: hypothetical protein JW818_20440 [Pirellulales bacterium]|nr:hypothetical protein [Pirellulales bacterium]